MSEVSEPVQEVPPVQEAKDVSGETDTTNTTKKEETEEERAERLAKQQEVDSRSVYVGNVDFKTNPEQLENFFNSAGVIERITILFDKYTGLPKGYAYVEFENKEAAQKAIDELDGKEFRNRELRVTTKRTNLPRMSNSRGRGGRGSFRGRGRGGRGSFRGRGRGRGGFRGRGRGGQRGRGGFKSDGGESTEPNGSTEVATEATSTD